MEKSYREILEYVGDISQVAEIQECRLSGGRAEGVRAAIVSNGSGLEYTVLPDRGMDILSVKYKGIPLNYRTGTGVTSPAYFNDKGTEWLRSFYSGAITTCGLTYFGQPQIDQGRELGLHGRISNTPAEDFGVRREQVNDDYYLHMLGVMKEASFFGENLSMTRSVETKFGKKGFRIKDLIRNNSFKREPLMILYHFNFGFPFLNPDSRIVAPVIQTDGGNETACSQEVLESFDNFSEPEKESPDQLFYHSLASDEDGRTFAALVNDRDSWGDAPLGVVIRFDRKLLPHLAEWKVMERQNYIVCLEPANCLPLGREQLRKEGKLPHLDGREEREFIIDYEIIDSPEELEKLEAEAFKMKKIYERKSLG